MKLIVKRIKFCKFSVQKLAYDTVKVRRKLFFIFHSILNNSTCLKMGLDSYYLQLYFPFNHLFPSEVPAK